MATVIDSLAGADGRAVEITIEPNEIAIVVRSPDHERPERAALTWDEFDTITDKLRAWRRLLAPPTGRPTAEPADEVGAFIAALAPGGPG